MLLTMVAATEPVPVPRRRAARAARTVLAAAITAAVFAFGLPQFASAKEVWHAAGHVSWQAGALLAAAAAWNLVTYWLVWMAAVPGLGLRRAALLTTAPTALANTVPGGSYLSIALTFSMLRSFGHRRSAATLAMVVTGTWNNFAKLAVPLVALVALALEGDVDAARVVAAGTGIAVLAAAVATFAAILRSPSAATKVALAASRAAAPAARVLRRPPPTGWDVALARFRTRTSALLAARWRWLTTATVTSHLSLYAVLLAALRATGVGADDVGAAEVLAVFAFARLVTAVPLTPGGVGVVELALTAGLVAAGGDEPAVVAAVLVYRALTYLVQIPLGAAAYLLWRRHVRAAAVGNVPDRAGFVRPPDRRPELAGAAPRRQGDQPWQ